MLFVDNFMSGQTSMPGGGEIGAGTFDIRSKTQIYGVLGKKPFGHQSSRWSKRFFIIKDGYLLYYPENEKKEAERKKHFNIHPKGVIPLDGCVIEAAQDAGQSYGINIKSDDFYGDIYLSADTEWEQQKWITKLENAGRITWSNAKLGDDMISQLENQGLKMAQEKQVYFDKFQSEAIALQDEKERASELECVKVELEKEKEKLEKFMADLKEEAEQIKQELDETSNFIASLKQEKQEIYNQKDGLKATLEGLATEKEKIIQELSQRDALTKQLTKEKLDLSEATESLSAKLTAIEKETERMLVEKASAEERLTENEERAQALEEEKNEYVEHSSSLQNTIKDLMEQKKVTESELKEEIIARLETEKRLQDAEESLRRLNLVLVKSGTKYTNDEKEDMLGNVKKLQVFFEDLAKEAQFDANKPLIMQTTISARKTFLVRTKSRRFYEKRRKHVQSMIESNSRLASSEDWSSDDHLDRNVPSNNVDVTVPRSRNLRRAVSMMTRNGPSVKVPIPGVSNS